MPTLLQRPNTLTHIGSHSFANVKPDLCANAHANTQPDSSHRDPNDEPHRWTHTQPNSTN